MTPIEFKAWFEGFTEGLSGKPDETQWEKIKKRVQDIDGRQVTQLVFVERYWPRSIGDYQYYPQNYWAEMPSLCYGAQNAAGASGGILANANQTAAPNNFDALDAMRQLGRAEAA